MAQTEKPTSSIRVRGTGYWPLYDNNHRPKHQIKSAKGLSVSQVDQRPINSPAVRANKKGAFSAKSQIKLYKPSSQRGMLAQTEKCSSSIRIRGTEYWPLYAPKELPKPLFPCGRGWLRSRSGALHWSARDDDDGLRHCIPTPAALDCASSVLGDV